MDLFFLNGYGLGFGLKNEKYELSFNGISKFYISRLCAIVPLYWFYIILVSVFITPEVWNLNGENICKLLNLFLFNYQEEYYSLEFGLAWYLTTMLRLALFAPAIFYLIRRIEKRVKNSFTLFIIAVVMGGLLLRVLALLCVIKYGGDWSRQVYKPFYFNFDLFITGIAVHYLPSGSFLNKSKIKFVRFAVILAFLAMIEVSSYLYFYGEKYGILRYRYSYVCFFPTIFLLLCIAFVYFFQNNSISLPSVLKKISFINGFRKIQYPMYLFHTSVLLMLQRSFDVEHAKRIIEQLGLDPNGAMINALFTLEGFFLTFILSCFITILFKTAKESGLCKRLMSLDFNHFVSNTFELSSKEYCKHSFLGIFGTQVLIVCLFCARGLLLYATNDDTTVASLIGGRIGGFTSYAINLHFFLGASLSGLAKLIEINVYTVYLLIVLLCSFIAIDYVFASRIRFNIQGLIAFFVITALYILSLSHFTFTVVSFFSGIAAMILLNNCFIWKVRKKSAVYFAILLLLQTMLIRAEVIFAISIIELFYIVSVFLQKKENISRPCKWLAFLPVLLVIIGLLSSYSNIKIEAINNTQRSFREWGEKRSEALDCAPIEYSEQLNQKGISISDYSAIYGAFYYNKDAVSIENMQAIIDENSFFHKYRFDMLAFISYYMLYLQPNVGFIFLHRFVYLLLIIFAIVFIKKGIKIQTLGIWSGVLAVDAIYFIIQRVPYRVEMPIFAFGSLLLLRLLLEDDYSKFNLIAIKSLKCTWKLLLLLIVCILGFAYQVLKYNEANAESYLTRVPVLDYMETYDDCLFLAGDASAFGVPCSENIWKYPGRKGQWNLLGNWEIYSVPYYNLMEAYDVSHPDDILQESINSNKILYLTQLGAEFPDKQYFIVSLVKEKYDLDTHFELVDIVDGTWYTYRLVQD